MFTKFKAKLRKKENVYISGKNAYGGDLLFWESTLFGKVLKFIGITDRIRGITGNYTKKLHVSNMIVNTGLAGASARIYDDAVVAKFTVLGIGTGTTAPAVGNTALEAEITTGGGAKGTATITRSTTSVLNDTTNWSKTWAFTASFAVTECGILNADSILLARVVFPALNVANGYSLTFNWSIDNA